MIAYSTRVKSIVDNSNISSKTYDIYLTDTFTKTKPTASFDFRTEKGSCILQRVGNDQDIMAGMIPSNFSMSLIADTVSKEAALDYIYDNADDPWYVLIFKDDSFWWGGYIQTESNSIDREFNPRYQIYAYDKLTLTGTQRFWDYQPTPRGSAPNNTIYGMGWRNNKNPSTTSQIPQFGWNYNPVYPRDTSVLGIIYSCLFDTDQQNLGEQDLNVVSWDVQNYNEDVAGIYRGLENTIIYSIDDYFFNDPANFLYNGGGTGIDNKNWLISDLLEEVCKMFRARLFQKDGEYYFIQWEAYRGDPSAGNMRVHTYRNSQRATPVLWVIFPDFKFTTVVSSYVTDINTYPRTNPEITGVTFVEKTAGADVVRYEFANAPWNDTKTTLERVLNNATVTNGKFSNFTDSSRRVYEGKNSFGFSNIINVVRDSSGVVINVTQNVSRYDGTTYQRKRYPDHVVDVAAEFKNGIRKKLSVTMIGDYDFFNLISLDGVSYLPLTEVHDLLNDTHQVTGIEFSSSTSNLGAISAVGGSYGQVQPPSGGVTPAPPPDGGSTGPIGGMS